MKWGEKGKEGGERKGWKGMRGKGKEGEAGWAGRGKGEKERGGLALAGCRSALPVTRGLFDSIMPGR